MKTNKKTKKVSIATATMPKIKYGQTVAVKNVTTTNQGAPAYGLSPDLELRRSVLSTFLGEDQFYENGQSIKTRIANLISNVKPEMVAALAIQARNDYNLRHIPLFLAREMARYPEHRVLVSYVLDNIIKRADEIAEFLSIYWAEGKCPLANQVKIGLANAFNRFNEYDFAKYNQDNAIKFRDVMFLVHPCPDDITKARSFSKQDRKKGKKRPASDKELLFNKIAQNTLQVPDTWEVRLSASNGEGKKKIWEELLDNGKLGGLAFLRNLRNMVDAGVNRTKVINYFQKANFSRVLPFRFISAVKHAPNFAAQLETAMLSCLDSRNKINGRTALLVDVSGSMDSPLSQKSENNRLETAYALAILAREMFSDVDVYTFSDKVIKMRNDLRGFSLRDQMHQSQAHSGTDLGSAVKLVNQADYERVIVFTDEQSRSKVDDPKNIGYMINVASAKNGVGYGKWVHIDGFSEAVIDFIREIEVFNASIKNKS